MNCNECRDQMIEAELKELAANGDSVVATHIRSCESCRQTAAALVRATSSLQSLYVAIEPVVVTAPIRRRLIGRRAAVGLALLAAAAMLTISVVVRREAPEDLHGGHWVDLPDAASVPIAVDVPDGRNAIVFATKNPLVDVVWIY